MSESQTTPTPTKTYNCLFSGDKGVKCTANSSSLGPFCWQHMLGLQNQPSPAVESILYS